MKKISKKEILSAVEEVIQQALTKFEIADPSKKTKKLVENVSRKVSGRIKTEVKRKFKKDRKAAERSKNANASKSEKKVGKMTAA